MQKIYILVFDIQSIIDLDACPWLTSNILILLFGISFPLFFNSLVFLFCLWLALTLSRWLSHINNMFKFSNFRSKLLRLVFYEVRLGDRFKGIKLK